jgi:hypothetical protein
MGPCVKTMHMNNMVNVSWQMNKDKDKGGESGLSEVEEISSLLHHLMNMWNRLEMKMTLMKRTEIL